MTPARARVLAAAAGRPRPPQARAGAGGVGERRRDRRPRRRGCAGDRGLAAGADRRAPRPRLRPRRLSDGQQAAAAELVAAVAARRLPPVTLLEGVTGSGKTEVYFEAVAEAVRQDRQALILMPEIALTGAVPRPLRRALRRRGRRPGIRASRGRRRERLYRRRRRRRGEGRGRRPLGPVPALSRSSASSSSTRSTRPPTSRRTASTTTPATWPSCAAASRAARSSSPRRRPRIETRVNAERGRYAPARSAGALRRPRRCRSIRAVDLRREAIAARALALADPRRRHARTRSRAASRRCSSSTAAAMRRSPCAAPARHRYECPNCSAWLVEHRFRARSSAIIAAMSNAAPRPARLRRARFARRLRPRRRAHRRGGRDALPGQAHASCCPATFPAAPSGCGRSSPPSRRASSTSSSARSSSPRATIFRGLTLRRRARCRYRPHLAAIRAPPSAPSSSCSR